MLSVAPRKILPDDIFIKGLYVNVIPIFLQGILQVSLNFVDVMILSAIGASELSAAAINMQIFFVYMVIVFGVSSGMGIFLSQLHGAQNSDKFNTFYCIGLYAGALIATIYYGAVSFFPTQIISLFTTEQQLAKDSLEFLEKTSSMYLFFSATAVISQAFRSIQQPKYTLWASGVSFLLNTLLNYILVFGYFGVEAMGLAGAAYATVISRIVELLLLLIFCYKFHPGILPRPSLIFNPSSMKPSFCSYLKICGPILSSSVLWVIGTSVYMMMYAKKDVLAFAALNVVLTIEKIGLVIVHAISQASTNILGEQLGRGDFDRAKVDALRFLWLTIIISILLISAWVSASSAILSLFNLSATSQPTAESILAVVSLVMIFKAINLLLYAGILRSGGDSNFCMRLDFIGVWFIGVPIAVYCVYQTNLELPIIVLLVGTEEVVKSIFGINRFLSGKWAKNVT